MKSEQVAGFVSESMAGFIGIRIKVLKVQWRFAFAFDPARKAVVLCGGAKSGVSQKLFYKRLIDLADKRYDEHLSELETKHGRS